MKSERHKAINVNSHLDSESIGALLLRNYTSPAASDSGQCHKKEFGRHKRGTAKLGDHLKISALKCKLN
jgi:hypothetical protein